MAELTTVQTDERVDLYNRRNTFTANMLITISASLCMLMAAVPAASTACAILMLPCMALLFFHEDFYVLSAIFIFFTEQLTISVGAPIARVYQYILFIRFFVYDLKGLKFRTWIFPAMLVFILYGIFVMPNADVTTIINQIEQRGQVAMSVMAIRANLVFKYYCDILYLLIIATKLYSDKDLLDKFLKMFIAVAAASGLYGIRADNTFVYQAGYVSEGRRQMASFNDPNYASCFINMAMFITLIKIKNKLLKIALIPIFYIYLVLAGSMTGFLLNGAGLIVYALIRYKKTALIVIAIIGAMLTGAVFAALNIPALHNLPAVQTVERRIVYQYINVEGTADEAVDTMTSGRSGQWIKYIEYFNGQDINNRLFGGNLLTTTTMDPYFKEHYERGPHEAYISFAINFGFVGLTIVVAAYIAKMMGLLIQTLKTRDDNEFALFMTSFAWFVYGFALDYFFDTRFMIFYFL